MLSESNGEVGGHIPRIGGEMNNGKTDVMRITRGLEEIQNTVDGVRPREMKRFSYMNVRVNSDEDMEKEIKSRIGVFSRWVEHLYLLIKSRHVPRKVKILIYIVILRPTLMYGEKAWIFKTRTRSRVKTAEMKALRVIRRVTKRDHLRSEDMKKKLSVVSIGIFIDR